MPGTLGVHSQDHPFELGFLREEPQLSNWPSLEDSLTRPGLENQNASLVQVDNVKMRAESWGKTKESGRDWANWKGQVP